jgi:hypothetical protein
MIIVGCARDVAKYWANTEKTLEHIFSCVPDYTCIIVESNSSDNTLELIQAWCSQDFRRQVISLGNLEGTRTERLATCRNEYMERIKDLDDPYTLMLDLDAVVQLQSDFKSQLESCLKTPDWDAVSSNRTDVYWDIWALRSKALGLEYDCWEMIDKATPSYVMTRSGLQKVDPIKKYMLSAAKVIPPGPWIPVESAFGGLTLYKTDAIRQRRYTGNTCEHVSFNLGLKMFIDPSFISGGKYA